MSDFVPPVSSNPRNYGPPKREKKGLPGWAIVVIFIIGMYFVNELMKGHQSSSSVSNSQQSNSSESSNPQSTYQSSTAKSSANFDIKVTSQIIKQVNGKYRYFFDIRNIGTDPFIGSVKIELDRADGGFGVGNEFESESFMDPSSGMSRFIELETAPLFVDAEYGVDRFAWEAVQDFETVQKGNGMLTSKVE